MAQFPNTPSFTGFNTPSRIEADIRDLQHEGTIPPELDGAFYRVQPDPQFPPLHGDDIAFNGDGMISRFHFHDGKCDFRQRWAQTDKWKLENAAGKALFGNYRNPLTDDDSVKGEIRGTACNRSTRVCDLTAPIVPQNCATPSSGVEACAYRRRGMRPAR